MSGAHKGGTFERDTCRLLSEWWTGGLRDDIFWRSSTSGARATVRTKKGKTTFGSYGDITALDPIGQPLMRQITFELKRGYNKQGSIADVLDSKPTKNPGLLESFFAQAMLASADGQTSHWVLIHRRDGHLSAIYFSGMLHSALLKVGAFENPVAPIFKMRCLVRGDKAHVRSIVGMQLTDFLKSVTPEHIKEIDREKSKVDA